MATHAHVIDGTRYVFDDLRTLLARATPARSGDRLAGVAAGSARERAAAQMTLADLPLQHFLHEVVVPYEADEVTRLIVDTHDAAAFAPIAHLTVGGFREWLLSDDVDAATLARAARGITPEMAAAVSKIMRAQDLVLAARKVQVTTRFRDTIGLPGRMSTRLQPNHPTDDLAGIAASVLDGLLYGSGDAVIGVNPALDNVAQVVRLLEMLDAVITRYEIPTQSCVLTHVTTTLQAIERGAPVDLVFQSIGGTQATNESFGVSLAVLAEAREAALSLRRTLAHADGVGPNVMYFETGQGSALSAQANHGCDQQTVEARAYAVARHFDPLLVNSVVGFIGPEYLYDGKQITRAGLEDHFCGKLLGLPMGVDVCYTNHAEADQDDMDVLLTVLGAAGCTFVMGVPGADDVMLNYQSTSFHDALYVRRVLGLRPAPEFEAWLERMAILSPGGGARLTRAPVGRAAGVCQGVADGRTDGQVSHDPVVSNPWSALRRLTPAHVGLGRAGVSVPTSPQLAFQLAHARARDAVHEPMDVARVRASLDSLGLAHVALRSAAGDRATYLQRPDLGRQLDEASQRALDTLGLPYRADCFDLAIAIVDGLSSRAIHRHAAPLLQEVLAALPGARGAPAQELRSAERHGSGAPLDGATWSLAPVAVVEQGRVAIGDAIGEALRARLVLVLIGERPGLSSPDSLGAYLTWEPRQGRTDAERNCLSNIRPEGLPYRDAAIRLTGLLRESRRRQLSGVALKDEHLLPPGATGSHAFLIDG